MSNTKAMRRYSADLKAAVAIAALKPDAVARKIAEQFGVHPSLVRAWRSRLLRFAPLAMRGTRPDVLPAAVDKRLAHDDVSLEHTFLILCLRRIQSIRDLKRMIDVDCDLSISRQAALIGLSRSTVYCTLRSGSVQAALSRDKQICQQDGAAAEPSQAGTRSAA